MPVNLRPRDRGNRRAFRALLHATAVCSKNIDA
jgi:hypothetical protein